MSVRQPQKRGSAVLGVRRLWHRDRLKLSRMPSTNQQAGSRPSHYRSHHWYRCLLAAVWNADSNCFDSQDSEQVAVECVILGNQDLVRNLTTMIKIFESIKCLQKAVNNTPHQDNAVSNIFRVLSTASTNHQHYCRWCK